MLYSLCLVVCVLEASGMSRTNYGLSARVRRPTTNDAVAVAERPLSVEVVALSSSSATPSPRTNYGFSARVQRPVLTSSSTAEVEFEASTSSVTPSPRVNYGFSARVQRPVSISVAMVSPSLSTVTAAAPAAAPSPPAPASAPPAPAPAPTPAPALAKTPRDEDAQLVALLAAFEMSQLGRLKLVSLEEATVARIVEVEAQKHDTSILEELAALRARKQAYITAEREVAQEMGLCAVGLRDEIAAIDVVTSSASRDERVLALINRFDAAAARRLLSIDLAIPESLAAILCIARPASPTVMGLSVTPGGTVAQIAASLRVKSNNEIAAVAGATLVMTGSSLVDATSAVVTTTAGFVFSEESKGTRDALATAAGAVWASIRALRSAVAAATKAYKANEPLDSEGELSVARVVAGIKGVYASDEFQEAVGSLGTNAQNSAVQAAKAATSAAEHLSSSLGQSPKYQGAYKVLSESLLTLLAILGAAASRAAAQLKIDMAKRLPASVN